MCSADWGSTKRRQCLVTHGVCSRKASRERLENPGVQMIQARKGLLILSFQLWLCVWGTDSLEKGEDTESRSV